MASVPSNRFKNPRRWGLCAVFAAPLIAAIIVVQVSPNYLPQPADGVRIGPVGGDFVQEWIGGTIVARGQSDKLYDQQFAIRLEHDAELLGYRWTAREYYPMVYPPFYYGLVSPLASWDIYQSATTWCLINALAFSIGLSWLAFLYRARFGNGVAFVAIAVLFHPLLLSLNMGQKSGWLLLILVATFALARQGRVFWSGVAFGCLVFKPQLALVIGPAMLFTGHYKFALGAMIPVGLATMGSLAMGWDACLGFLQVIGGFGSYSEHSGYSLVDAHNIWGAAKCALEGSPLGIDVVVAICLAIAILLALAHSLRGRIGFTDDRFPLQFAAMILATILLCPHYFTYDLSVLLVPMILVAGYFTERQASSRNATAIAEASRRTWHWMLIGTIFCASGLFRPIAEMSGIQISIALLGGWLALIGWELQRQDLLKIFGALEAEGKCGQDGAAKGSDEIDPDQRQIEYLRDDCVH